MFCTFSGCHWKESSLVCVNLPLFTRYLYVKKVHVTYPSSFLISFSSGSSSSMGFVERIFFITRYMCTFSVATLLGRYLVTSCTLSPCHDWKSPFWISLTHVYFTGMNADTLSYLTRYVCFVMFYALLILCSMSFFGFFLRVLSIWRLPCTLYHKYFQWIPMTCVLILLGYDLLLLLGVIVLMTMYIL